MKGVQEEWERQLPMFRAIAAQGMDAFMKAIPDIDAAFTLRDRYVRGIDEGTPGGVHTAGSGILMSEQDAVHAMQQAHVTGVTSHAGCGAAALYAKEKGLEGVDTDAYGIAWAEKFAERLGVPYIGHISAQDMARPAAFHNARVVYYDATGTFDPSRVAALPPGFVISRKYLTPTHATAEAGVAVRIATGDHGFGARITPEQPCYLVPVSDPAHPAEVLAQELQPIVAAHAGRVRISGFMLQSTS